MVEEEGEFIAGGKRDHNAKRWTPPTRHGTESRTQHRLTLMSDIPPKLLKNSLKIPAIRKTASMGA